MKKWLYFILFLAFAPCLMAQQWSVGLDEDRAGLLRDLIPVDGGEYILCIGSHTTDTSPCRDGMVVKVDKEGNLNSRVIHLPGMTLEYFSAVQLPNGNYMAFGVCNDSLGDYNSQKYLRIDVFDAQLDDVASQTYSVDDETFDFFNRPANGHIMKSIVTKSGTALLATRLSYYLESLGFYSGALRLYEFDETGNILRIDANPLTGIGSIKELTYIPDTDHVMIILDGGVFGYNAGVVGLYVIDTDLDIIGRQMLTFLNAPAPITDHITDVACEGYWIDGQYLIIDGERYEGSSFTYHTLYKVDVAMNVHASVQLPPYDSCTWVPLGTNTAYVNDSTIFAVSFCCQRMSSMDACQSNVLLVDKHLNLLGRKTIREDDVLKYVAPPAAFNDGGCLVLVYSYSGNNYPGEEFSFQELMKFRREDIEITWDVVHESATDKAVSLYPNPTDGIVNIQVGERLSGDARLQMFDAEGTKCLDSAIGDSGSLITLDLHNLDAGLYVYKVVSGDRTVASGKFVKH